MREPTTSELVLYRTEDGRTRIQCRFEDQTLWLTQSQLAELFQSSVPNINQHLTAVFEEGELAPEATVKSHLIVRQEGARQVTRTVMHYSLPVILGAALVGPSPELFLGLDTQRDDHARVPC